MSPIIKYLIVWIFGGIGAMTRYGIFQLFHAKGWSQGNWIGLPTLVINVPACFLIGIFAGYLTHSSWANDAKTIFSLAAMTGFCGGFSTFSTYTLDSLHYFEQGRINGWAVFALLTFLLSLFLCAIGYWLGKKI